MLICCFPRERPHYCILYSRLASAICEHGAKKRAISTAESVHIVGISGAYSHEIYSAWNFAIDRRHETRFIMYTVDDWAAWSKRDSPSFSSGARHAEAYGSCGISHGP